MTDLLLSAPPTPLQRLNYPGFDNAGVAVFVKRDDLIHPAISGNKWRKLKYSLLYAQSNHFTSILTFGGAYSNHLYATAAAGKLINLATIGIVRGKDAQNNASPTLQFCREQGMQLHFVDRNQYRLKESAEFLQTLSEQYNQPYIIPEGGTTQLALRGVGEMVEEVKVQLGQMPDYFSVAAGTGGTAAGIVAAGANALVFPALKGGHFLEKDMNSLIQDYPKQGNLQLFTDYHFGGYAKWNTELLYFIDFFQKTFGIQLEQVYTAKMFWGLFDLIQKGFFEKGSRIVAVHTGGLQGLLRK